MKKVICVVYIMLSFSYVVDAQRKGPQSLNDLKQSPAGGKILAFVDKVNGKESISDQWIKSIFSDRIIEKNGKDKLREFIKDIRQNDAPLDLYDVNRVDMLEYQAKALSNKNNTWLDAVFKLSKNQYKIDWFSWFATRVPAKSKARMYPLSKTNKKKKPNEKQIIDKINRMVQAYTDLGWFSGSVLVAKKGTPIFSKGYGYADIENKIPCTVNTVFPTGSMGKDFNQVLILQHMEEGKLSLDDTLDKFDLGFPKEIAQKITIRHLLTHTSGFGDIFVPEMENNREKYRNNKDLLKLHLNSPLLFEPGTNQRYSNYGYTVLALINEKVSNKSYSDLLQRKIFDKVNMPNSKYATIHEVDNSSKIYTFEFDGTKKNASNAMIHKSGAGGLVNTVGDLLNFYQALYYSNVLLKDGSKELMINDYKPTKLRWSEIVEKSVGWSGFAGGSPALNTAVEYVLKDNFFIVISANTGRISELLMAEITEYIRGGEVRKPQLPVEHQIYKLYSEKGVKYLKSNLSDIAAASGSPYHEGILNRIGYTLLQKGKKRITEVIEIFKLNTELFPESANVYDSLAEAYYIKGNRSKALEYYQKALAIDPNFPSAKKMIKKLKT